MSLCLPPKPNWASLKWQGKQKIWTWKQRLSNMCEESHTRNYGTISTSRQRIWTLNLTHHFCLDPGSLQKPDIHHEKSSPPFHHKPSNVTLCHPSWHVTVMAKSQCCPSVPLPSVNPCFSSSLRQLVSISLCSNPPLSGGATHTFP